MFRYFTSSRHISYCFLGWGLPLVLLLILLVFDHIKNLEILPPPDVGIQSCFLLEESMNIFLHVPIFIFMFINTFHYISTVFYIFRTRNAIKYVFSLLNLPYIFSPFITGKVSNQTN